MAVEGSVLEVVPQFGGLLMTGGVMQGMLQALQGSFLVLLGQVDKGHVVVDGRGVGTAFQSSAQVGAGRDVILIPVMEDSAIENCRSKGRIELEGAVVVFHCAIVSALAGKGRGPVVVARSAVGGQSNTNRESVDSLLVLPEAINTNTVVEMGPQTLRLEVDGALQMFGGK